MTGKTKNYRLDLSSKWAPHINNHDTVKTIIKERIGKIGRGSQLGA
jgi:hypothetical protein